MAVLCYSRCGILSCLILFFAGIHCVPVDDNTAKPDCNFENLISSTEKTICNLKRKEFEPISTACNNLKNFSNRICGNKNLQNVDLPKKLENISKNYTSFCSKVDDFLQNNTAAPDFMKAENWCKFFCMSGEDKKLLCAQILIGATILKDYGATAVNKSEENLPGSTMTELTTGSKNKGETVKPTVGVADVGKNNKDSSQLPTNEANEANKANIVKLPVETETTKLNVNLAAPEDNLADSGNANNNQDAGTTKNANSSGEKDSTTKKGTTSGTTNANRYEEIDVGEEGSKKKGEESAKKKENDDIPKKENDDIPKKEIDNITKKDVTKKEDEKDDVTQKEAEKGDVTQKQDEKDDVTKKEDEKDSVTKTEDNKDGVTKNEDGVTKKEDEKDGAKNDKGAETNKEISVEQTKSDKKNKNSEKSNADENAVENSKPTKKSETAHVEDVSKTEDGDNKKSDEDFPEMILPSPNEDDAVTDSYLEKNTGEDNSEDYIAPAEKKSTKEKAAQPVLPEPEGFPEYGDSHFFVYFLTIAVLCVVLYLAFHNKQKIIALLIEGRQERRRRSNVSYKKLDSNLDEVLHGSGGKGSSMTPSHIIY